MFPTRPHVERAGPQILRLVSPRSALFLLPFFGADFQKFSGFATGTDVVRKDKKPSSVGLFAVLKLAAGRGISDAIFLKISCPEDARARFTQGGKGKMSTSSESYSLSYPVALKTSVIGVYGGVECIKDNWTPQNNKLFLASSISLTEMKITTHSDEVKTSPFWVVFGL